MTFCSLGTYAYDFQTQSYRPNCHGTAALLEFDQTHK